jgi:tRNA threonylcarbamoyl adenosine modification protein YjeE
LNFQANLTAASHQLVLPTEQATRRLAADVAAVLAPGDLVTLSGDLGAGKTTFARALIRHLAGDERLEVPSPTFTFIQSYALPRFPLVHADLYRISEPRELAELGFEEAIEGAAALLEWPDRANGLLPPDRLDIGFHLAPALGPSCRDVRITAFGSFVARTERLFTIWRFLAQAGYGDVERQFIQGDASTRSYERLVKHGGTAILMNAPRRPDGPPLRDGKPYSAIAHLAEDIRPFVAIARALRARGFSAPEIYAADLAEGLLVLEDLGTEAVVASNTGPPIQERYATAVDVLVALHRQQLPEVLPVAPRIDHPLPTYDLDALLIEAELLVDWYVPHRGRAIEPAARSEFLALWRPSLQRAIQAPRTWVLRDYHSPNLLWLPKRQGMARVGLLDFQDALLGPAAYDVVSLLQDARVDVPEQLEMALLGGYVRARAASDPAFRPSEFLELYATLGAQRATKILGIFARLDRRDGKSQYLRHLPRVYRYLTRSLAHPSLATLKAWYDGNIPAPG